MRTAHLVLFRRLACPRGAAPGAQAPAHGSERAGVRRVHVRPLRTGAALLGALSSAACVAGRGAPLDRITAPPARLTEVRIDTATVEGGHLVQPVRLRDASGLTVDLLVKRPRPTPGEPEMPAPLVVILGGHHAGREAARLIPDTRGHAVVSLAYPYQGKHRLSALGALRAAPAIRRAVLDTPRATRLALDWLLAQPWADARRVEGIGASLGTPFMTVTAALDPRITRLWSVHGAGDNYRLLAHNTRAYVKLKPLRSLAVRGAAALVEARTLDADRWVARVAPRPVVLLNATDDERLPRPAVQALHDSARAPREIVWLPGQHIQRNRPDIVRGLVAAVLGRMLGDSTGTATPVDSARGG